MTSDLESLKAEIQLLRDRVDIEETIYRYATTIDVCDWDGLRSVLADDVQGNYANMRSEPVNGADEMVAWIREATVGPIWQHHLLSVYSVEITGDTAKVLVYHTSHQNYKKDPETIDVLVGRYTNYCVRTSEGWKISNLNLEVGWGEQRKDVTGYFKTVGGRGPIGTIVGL